MRLHHVIDDTLRASADRGERRAKLVGNILEKDLLLLICLIQLERHAVHGIGKNLKLDILKMELTRAQITAPDLACEG